LNERTNALLLSSSTSLNDERIGTQDNLIRWRGSSVGWGQSFDCQFSLFLLLQHVGLSFAEPREIIDSHSHYKSFPYSKETTLTHHSHAQTRPLLLLSKISKSRLNLHDLQISMASRSQSDHSADERGTLHRPCSSSVSSQITTPPVSSPPSHYHSASIRHPPHHIDQSVEGEQRSPSHHTSANLPSCPSSSPSLGQVE
jgi:hypothetical protein